MLVPPWAGPTNNVAVAARHAANAEVPTLARIARQNLESLRFTAIVFL